MRSLEYFAQTLTQGNRAQAPEGQFVAFCVTLQRLFSRINMIINKLNFKSFRQKVGFEVTKESILQFYSHWESINSKLIQRTLMKHVFMQNIFCIQLNILSILQLEETLRETCAIVNIRDLGDCANFPGDWISIFINLYAFAFFCKILLLPAAYFCSFAFQLFNFAYIFGI